MRGKRGDTLKKLIPDSRGFVCAFEGGALCIIYNSSLRGKIISLKKTESVAYIHV